MFVAAIGVMAIRGGMFVLISGAVNACRFQGRGGRRGLRLLLSVFLPLAARCGSPVLVRALVGLVSPAAGLNALRPAWNATIGPTMLSAATNVLLGLAIVALSSRGSSRFTVEHLWVRLFPGSTRLDGVS